MFELTVFVTQNLKLLISCAASLVIIFCPDILTNFDGEGNRKGYLVHGT